MIAPRQGEVWWVDLDPTRGGEIRKQRPALVLSNDALNAGSLRLAIIAPITTTPTGRKLHVGIELRGDGDGTSRRGYVLPEQVRSVSHERLTQRIGRATGAQLASVRGRIALLLRDDL